ncbi:hypothetical protein F4818DRAFT_446741 [Hypoxylon cercidicola]|nr:hypothetical protein F4818DRAFT_446741 [Hypoxylon cercidicola]
MRFVTFTSVALFFASAVWTAPAATTTALVSRDDQISVEARGIPEDLHFHTAADIETLEARKPKWQKIDVEDKTGRGKGGKIPQNQWEDAKEKAQKALFQADCTKGDVVNKWHIDGSQDPEEHITVKPRGGDGEKKGEIHVHRDGSWTQGAGGKANSGNGNV